MERKKELKMLQTPRVNMLVLAFTGLPPAAKMKTHRITFTFNHFFLIVYSQMRRQTDIFLEIDSLLGSCIVSDPVIIDQNNLEYLDHDV